MIGVTGPGDSVSPVRQSRDTFAILVDRKIKWDAKKEVIVGDAEASKLLGRAYRAPWKLS